MEQDSKRNTKPPIRNHDVRQQLLEAGWLTTRMLLDALHLKDPSTSGHSSRVGECTYRLAAVLGMGPTEIDRTVTAALLHDIGKIGVCDAILFKESGLNSEEWTEIRRHCEYGWSILRDIPQMEEVGLMLLHHHERFDGHGYPVGLKGNEIPYGARIIAVADAFDAMTSDRPYRASIGVGAAVHELTVNAGTQFDPEIVKAFLDLLQRDTARAERAARCSQTPSE
jgi:HD-GYP domain-containing protein (c-di-GMP phosphodiesterase class II)